MPTFTLPPLIERDSIFLRDLPLSQLRLQNQSLVPWLVLVPRCTETEIYQLSAEDRVQLMEEITLTSKAIMAVFKPDKINVAALGNVVPQLHVHVIGRFHNDPAWPQPVWGRLEANPYSAQAIKDIQGQLKNSELWH